MATVHFFLVTPRRCSCKLENGSGFEPLNSGFADRRVGPLHHPSKGMCKVGFLPTNPSRINSHRFYRYAIFVGGVRRPIRVPLLRFQSPGHDRQGPQAVVGSSEFPSDLSTPRQLTPTRRIQGTSSKLLAQIKATEGFAPPYPIVPWTSPSTDSNRLSGLCKRTAPRGACISRLPCCQMLEPIARIGLAYPVYETGVLPLN